MMAAPIVVRSIAGGVGITVSGTRRWSCIDPFSGAASGSGVRNPALCATLTFESAERHFCVEVSPDRRAELVFWSVGAGLKYSCFFIFGKPTAQVRGLTGLLLKAGPVN
jgi:hypothetical protein